MSRTHRPLGCRYGITLAERHADPDLAVWRERLIESACKKLHAARMLVYVPSTGALRSAPLGRVASTFYVDHDTVGTFTHPSTGVQEWMSDEQILALLGEAAEFAGVKVRQEEMAELDGLQKSACELPVRRGGVEHAGGKVNVLLQSYLSGARISAFSLVIDQMYVAREAGRLLRAVRRTVAPRWNSTVDSTVCRTVPLTTMPRAIVCLFSCLPSCSRWCSSRWRWPGTAGPTPRSAAVSRGRRRAGSTPRSRC